MPENITWPPIGGDTYPIPKSGETNWPSLTNFLTALRNAQGTKAQKVASRTATSSPVTVSQAEDHTIIINLTAPGPCVVNLPAGIPGQVYAICDGSGLAGANPITLMPNGSELIQGQSEMLINQNYAAVIIGFDEVSQWRVLALAAGEGTGGGVSRSTLDAGNPNYVIINGIDGKLSEEQRLATVRGGLGIDASALNGYLKFVSGTASAGGIDAADIPSGIDAAKISSGAVSNTVFNFLVGVTSSIQTQLDSKLPSNQQLVNLSSTITNLTTSGFVAENGIGLFEKRQIAAGSSKVSISNPAGIAGNPTIDVSEANLTLDNLGGTLSISKGGTGQTTAAAAAAALLPTQAGQNGKVLGTDGSALSWVAGGGSGGLTPVAVSSTGTCTANTVELCNVAGGTITRTLPSLPAGGADAISLLILDNGSASNTKKITIAPASGQTISGYAANDTVSINYEGGWVALYAESDAANWEIQTSASTAVPPATNTSPGTISAENDSGWLTLPAVSWNGTAPTTLTTSLYRWVREGKQITLTWYQIYSSAGTGNSQATWVLPGTVPPPSVIQPGGYWSYVGNGELAPGPSNRGTGSTAIDSNSGVHTIYTSTASGAYRVNRGTIVYLTD